MKENRERLRERATSYALMEKKGGGEKTIRETLNTGEYDNSVNSTNASEKGREYKINRIKRTSSTRYGIELKSSYKVFSNYEYLKISYATR